MALWQITFHIVPKNHNFSLVENISLFSFIEEEFFDDELLWKGFQNYNSIIDDLKNILPKEKFWTDKGMLFGKIDETCIEIFFENNEIQSLSIRIDFRENYKAFLMDFIRFCTTYDLIFVETVNMTTIPLDQIAIESYINDNKQVRVYNKLSRKSD